jgi:hypothetical protein
MDAAMVLRSRETGHYFTFRSADLLLSMQQIGSPKRQVEELC